MHVAAAANAPIAGINGSAASFPTGYSRTAVMPGPKMGPRPEDFDEDVVRQAPTFIKWTQLKVGEKLRYACRDFIRGRDEDEERLMRRIMIARRNNLRDHELLKKAREVDVDDPTNEPVSKKRVRKKSVTREEGGELPTDRTKRLRTSRSSAATMSDTEVRDEMDIAAVEATRSYKTWKKMADGDEFTYNQKYIKGKPGHDWLLKKNVWRRMRYRRENKRMVEQLKVEDSDAVADAAEAATSKITARHPAAIAAAAAVHEASGEMGPPALPTPTVEADNDPVSMVGDGHHPLLTSAEEDGQDGAAVAAAAASAAEDLVHKAVVEAAVKAAESYVQKAREESAAEAANHADIIAAAASTAAAAAAEAMSAAVNNPIMGSSITNDEDEDGDEALQMAAELAASVPPPEEDDEIDKISV